MADEGNVKRRFKVLRIEIIFGWRGFWIGVEKGFKVLKKEYGINGFYFVSYPQGYKAGQILAMTKKGFKKF